MSTDQSHVRFVVKGEKVECDQTFLTTNYPDLLIRKTLLNGVIDRDLITRPLPKDELKLSTFITNRDDYVYYSIMRTLKKVFARSRKMVIPITHQSLVKNRDFNHSPITISNGDSNHSPITNQITLHNFLGSNFDYYISNKYSFSIITVVQSACQSILTYSLWASAVKFRQDFLLVDGTGKPK